MHTLCICGMTALVQKELSNKRPSKLWHVTLRVWTPWLQRAEQEPHVLDGTYEGQGLALHTFCVEGFELEQEVAGSGVAVAGSSVMRKQATVRVWVPPVKPHVTEQLVHEEAYQYVPHASVPHTD
jgi:hypothetical protein